MCPSPVPGALPPAPHPGGGPRLLTWGLALAGLAALLAPLASPSVDLTVAGWFWSAAGGFIWREAPVAVFLHTLVQVAARVLAAGLVIGLLASLWRRRPVLGLDVRAWLFLGLALGIGPGLIGNSVLKDHWHRARPVQIIPFGGGAPYTPPLLPAPGGNCKRNCSFVSGDAVLAFFLHSFGYVVPVPGSGNGGGGTGRRGRRLFWGGLGVGALVGLLRIGMGGHFFSDVVYAAALTLATSALLHAALYGRDRTAALWRGWMGGTA